MTTEEIFLQLYSHMNKGVLFHIKAAKAFGFLKLQGYQKCHEYHEYEENYNCDQIYNFYLTNYNKLLPIALKEDIEVFPQLWHKYMRQDVDIKTKRESIQMLIKKWIQWEEESVQLVEQSYKQLYELNEPYAANFLMKFIVDVNEELKGAKELLIDLESGNYDMPTIIVEQESLYKKYTKQLKKIYKDDE